MQEELVKKKKKKKKRKRNSNNLNPNAYYIIYLSYVERGIQNLNIFVKKTS